MSFDPYSDDSRRTWIDSLTKERKLGHIRRLESLMPFFSPAERLVLYILSIIFVVSAFGLVVEASHAISSIVPGPGGEITEGEIAPVRFINPILALSQADSDLSALVYSGLMRAEPDGTYVPDLAQGYTVSPDGTTYTFTLRPNATFQDGTKVTSADVLFTIQLAQNPDVKSPQRANWEGVQVSAPDDHTVVFKLPHAYAPFLENTTLGILPKHLWQNISTEELPFSPLNTHPIGSGPYQVSNFSTDSTGSATRYTFVPFKNFALGAPYLRSITFVFYSSESDEIAAFNTRAIDALAGFSPDQAANLSRSDSEMLEVPLPRVFGIFLNQTHAPVLQDAGVRAALDQAIDKQLIVNAVLDGYGVPLSGPIPPGVLGNQPQVEARALPIKSAASTTSSVIDQANLDQAHAALVKDGWVYAQNASSTSGAWHKGKQTLSFTLATADEPELVATAQDVAAVWQALGVQVTVQVYPLSQFNTDVLRPRQYDAVLFGEVVGRTLDLFAFWHSSQRNDPGLNLAMYASTKSDALLSEARATTDPMQRDQLYQEFAAQLQKDEPAIFLYAPDFLYALPKDVRGVTLGALTDSSERFLTVYQWYTETQYVWNFLTREQ